MPWSRIRFNDDEGTLVAGGYYSSLAARQLEIVGFAYDPDTGLHHLPGLRDDERLHRVAAARALLRFHGITRIDRPHLSLEELMAAVPRAATVRDLAVLGQCLFDHPDNPARVFEAVATRLRTRLSRLDPPGLPPTLLRDIEAVAERCVDIAGQLAGITDQLHTLTADAPATYGAPPPNPSHATETSAAPPSPPQRPAPPSPTQR